MSNKNNTTALWRTQHAVADSRVSEVKDGILKSFSVFRKSFDVNVDFEALSLSLMFMKENVRDAVVSSGKSSKKHYAEFNSFEFNVDSYRIDSYIDVKLTKRIDDMVGLSSESYFAMSDYIDSNNISKRDSETLRKYSATLTPRQSVALKNYRELLVENQPNRSISSDFLEGYADRLEDDRADTISNSELMAGVLFGTYELWDQAHDSGVIDKNRASKVWVVTPDDRLCYACNQLSGVVLGYNEEFFSVEYGWAWGPTLHARCRCSLDIIF